MKILVVSYLAMGIATSLLLCSCAGLSVNESFYAKDVPRKVPFNEADFPHIYRSGSGSVYGHDFLNKMNDSTEDTSNAEIQLFPVTPYTTEFVRREFAADTYLASPDPRYLKYVRTVHADQNGNFRSPTSQQAITTLEAESTSWAHPQLRLMMDPLNSSMSPATHGITIK